MDNLKSPLKNILPNFIKYKKSLGYEYSNTEKFFLIDSILIKNEIKSLDDIGKINKLILENNQLKKYQNEIKELIKFKNIIENKKELFNIVTMNRNNNTSKYIPFIISENLFKKICKYIDETSKYKQDNLKYIYPVIYRLLYSTGIRISEAIGIKPEDLDINSNTITIKNSKNNKSRIIVISDSMCEVLKQYVAFVKPKKYLFEYRNKCISYSKIFQHLKTILSHFNLKFSFHDFRHSMATISFKKLFEQGYEEKVILYYLHIYLGHSSINETEYYFYFNNTIKERIRCKNEK